MSKYLNQETPHGWKFGKIEDIASIKSGSTPSRASHERYFNGGVIPWVKTMDLTNGHIYKTDERITPLALEESSCPLLKSGTVLVAMYGGFNQIGRTGLMTFDGTINQAISALIINREVAIPKYVLYWLNQNVLLWRRFAASSRKDPNITRSDVASFPIYLPPLPEQRKIAQILSTWDEAIALVEALIAALQERKKGLMQRLLTGEVRFPWCDGEWEEVRLGYVFAERNETGFDHLPLVAITMEDGIIWRDELDRKDTSSADKSNYLRICPGDIGYNTMRMWQGVSGVSDIEGIVSPAYTVCVPSQEVDVHFMGYLFQLPEMIHKFWRYSQGLVKDTLTLRFSNFAEIKVNIPSSRAEQSEIAKVLRTVDKAINQLETYGHTLRTEKKGLMQRLLTGEVRVQVEE